jgi:hypothetical protein
MLAKQLDKFFHQNLKKKLKAGNSKAFRIRIDNYQLGLIIENDTVCFVRLLSRGDIYRYFPCYRQNKMFYIYRGNPSGLLLFFIKLTAEGEPTSALCQARPLPL